METPDVSYSSSYAMAKLLGMSLDTIGDIQLGQLIPESYAMGNASAEESDLRVSDYNANECKIALVRSKRIHAPITSDAFQRYRLKNPEEIRQRLCDQK